VQRDIKLARTWFEKAAALNNAQASVNLKRLERAGLTDGTQIAARRASCVQSCAALHTSYVSSVCDRYSAVAESDKSERTKCIDMSLRLARHCRDSCREWAPTPQVDNKCVGCFQTLIACSTSQEPTDGHGSERPYATDSQDCLAALAECKANCLEQPFAADGENPD